MLLLLLPFGDDDEEGSPPPSVAHAPPPPTRSPSVTHNTLTRLSGQFLRICATLPLSLSPMKSARGSDRNMRPCAAQALLSVGSPHTGSSSSTWSASARWNSDWLRSCRDDR